MATNSIIEKVKGTDSSSNRIASTFYCTCSTAAATAQKDATPSDSCVFNDSCLITGVTVHVKFTNSNTHATPTLKVGTATAKQIMKYGTTKPGTTATTSWQAGSVISFTYDGTYWQMNDHLDDTITTNTDTKVTQTNLASTDENYYKILFSGTADNVDRTEGAKKSADLSFSQKDKKLNCATVTGFFSDIKTNIEGSASRRYVGSINCKRGNSVEKTENVSHNTDTRVDDFYLYPGTWLVICGVYFSSNATGSRWMYVNDDSSDTVGKTQLIDDLDSENVGYLGRAACAASTNSGTGLNVNFMLTVTETRHI